MDFKKLFIGGLCASAVLAGCTKELSAPSVEGNQAAVSLGEGLTITGSKGSFGVTTKAAWDKDFRATWEESDMLGAAWYDAAKQNAFGGWSSNNNVANSFMSNTWFKFDKWTDKEAGKADFSSAANLFAGAYVLYYPYDLKWTELRDFIPVNSVKTTQTMDITPGKELEHLKDGMFFYTTYKAIPGGANLSEEFTMNPLANVLAIRFRVDKPTLMQLEKPVEIAMVVLESNKDIMFKEGKITYSDKTIDYTEDLPAAQYNPDRTKVAHQIILEVAGDSGNTAYAFTELKKSTAPFYISVLPFAKLAAPTDLAVKIVTKDGKVYVGNPSKEAMEDVLNEYAVKEGTLVNLNIELSDLEDSEEIYTADQFKTQWAAAVKEGEGELKVMTPITVGDFDLNLKNKEKIKITGSNVTVGNLNITNGTLTFDNTLTVKDLTLGTGSDITGGTLAVSGKTSVDSKDAKITVSKIGEIAVSKTGTLTVTGTGTGASKPTMGAVQNEGTLTLSNVNVSNLTNDSSVDMKSNVVVTGTLTNNATLTGAFENDGVVNINKALNYSKLTITNCEGSTRGHSRGVVNVNATSTLNVANEGEINVAKGVTLTFNGSCTNGVINAEGAIVKAGTSLSSFTGSIVTDDVTKVNNNAFTNCVVLVVTDELDDETGMDMVKTYRVKTENFKLLKTSRNVELYAGAKWTIPATVASTFTADIKVFGNAKIVAEGTKAVALTFKDGSEVVDGVLALENNGEGAFKAQGEVFVKDSNSIKVGAGVDAAFKKKVK